MGQGASVSAGCVAGLADVNAPTGGPGPNARGGGGDVYYGQQEAAVVQNDAPVKQAAPAPAPGVTAQFYHWDHVGTVRLITDNAGHVVSRHDYTPYGVEVLPAVSVSGNTHQFTGQERDPMTGSDYMHFRYYGSNIGRFYKPDNITGSAMNPQDWNRYSYVHGNPINFNDPTGHDPNDPKKEKQEGLKTVKEPHHAGEKTGQDAEKNVAAEKSSANLKVGDKINPTNKYKVGEVQECYHDVREDPKDSADNENGEQGVAATTAEGKAAQTLLKGSEATMAAKDVVSSGANMGDECVTVVVIYQDKSCPGNLYCATYPGGHEKQVSHTAGGMAAGRFTGTRTLKEDKPTPLPRGLIFQGVWNGGL